MLGRSNKKQHRQQVISLFEQEIAKQEDVLYGVALFFECLSLIHADHSGVVETNRKQYRNIIQNGANMIKDAYAVLAEVKENPKKIELIEQFKFTPCQGHPQPGELIKRAQSLVNAYKRIFPNRARSKDFSEEETFKLIEGVSPEF